jgi:hypothetical protein
MGLSPAAAADARLEQRITFDFAFAAIFIVALHEFSALKVVLILYLNFSIAKKLPKEYIPVATWVFNISVLFANEAFQGYHFASFWAFFLPQTHSVDGKPTATNWGQWLDSHGGLISRWEVLFNITILRLISFNMDYYWSLRLRGSSPVEVRTFPIPLAINLTASRRSSSIPRICQKEIGYQYLRSRPTFPSATISPTSCTPHSISLDQS